MDRSVPKVKLYREASAATVDWPEEPGDSDELPFHQRDRTACIVDRQRKAMLPIDMETVDMARKTIWIPGEVAKAGEDIYIR